MYYPIPAASPTGEVALATFDEENVDGEAVQQVREAVTFDVNPDLPYNPVMTTVEVEIVDGETYTRHHEKPPCPQRPAFGRRTPEEVRDVCRPCAGDGRYR